MAVLAQTGTALRTTPRDLHPETALRYAWYGWMGMLLVPFLMFLAVAWTLMDEDITLRDASLANTWFVACMAYMALIVPAAIFMRSYVFKAYWAGECVHPKSYLKGMLAVWTTIEIGGVLSLVGCLVSHSLLPNLLPALVAFMLFTPLWPSGMAMVRHCGNQDDPGEYKEPR